MGGYCLFRGTSHLFNMIPGKHISWLRLPSTLIIDLEAPTEYWSTIPHLQGWTFNTKLDAFKAQYPSNHSGRKFRPFQKISCNGFPHWQPRLCGPNQNLLQRPFLFFGGSLHLSCKGRDPEYREPSQLSAYLLS